MIHNIGKTDRTIRFIGGTAVVAAGLIYGSWWGLIGLVFIGTAFIRTCPSYIPFGISTVEKGERTSH